MKIEEIRARVEATPRRTYTCFCHAGVELFVSETVGKETFCSKCAAALAAEGEGK